MAATLGQPLTLPCGLTLPNRLAKTATSEHLAHPLSGQPTHELVTLYRCWAEGGAGLIITGNVMVDERYLEGPSNVVAHGREPSETWKAWALASKTTGRADKSVPIALVQLSHPGRQCPLAVSLRRPVAPSEVSFRLPGVGLQLFRRPRALDADEVRELPGRFARAAELSIAAGFDGIQIHAAHGYLLSQFLSPHTNRRQDDYGGSPEQRRLLLLEIVAAVRAVIGPSRVISVKVNSRDFRRGGLGEDEAAGVVTALCDAGVDLVEISGGTYEAMACLENQDQEGFFLDFASRLRRDLPHLPLMVTGGFRSRTAAEEALKGGGCDVVGLCRVLCLDPCLPERWLAKGSSEVATVPPVRLKVPIFRSLLIPGLNYLWHQRQLQRLAASLPVEREPNHAIVLKMLVVKFVANYLWEPRRLSLVNRAILAALAAAVVAVIFALP